MTSCAIPRGFASNKYRLSLGRSCLPLATLLPMIDHGRTLAMLVEATIMQRTKVHCFFAVKNCTVRSQCGWYCIDRRHECSSHTLAPVLLGPTSSRPQIVRCMLFMDAKRLIHRGSYYCKLMHVMPATIPALLATSTSLDLSAGVVSTSWPRRGVNAV